MTARPDVPFARLIQQDPAPTPTDRIRDAIAARAERMEAQFPKAIDLEARVLAAMRPHLSGTSAILNGTHCPENWRESLRGERSLSTLDVSRLALSDRREARAAVIALLHELADAVGHQLVPQERRSAGDAFECIAQAVDRAGQFATAAVQAGRDGDIDARERRDLIARIEEQEAKLACAKGALR